MLVCQGPSFYLKFLIKKERNSKNIAFRVMPLVLPLHLIMMRKYSKFGVDNIFNIVLVMGYIKGFARRRSSNQNSSTFSWKQTSWKGSLDWSQIYSFKTFEPNKYTILQHICTQNTVAKHSGIFFADICFRSTCIHDSVPNDDGMMIDWLMMESFSWRIWHMQVDLFMTYKPRLHLHIIMWSTCFH